MLATNYLNLLILVRTHKPTKKVSHLHQDINRPFLSKVLLCLLRKIARKYSDEISENIKNNKNDNGFLSGFFKNLFL